MKLPFLPAMDSENSVSYWKRGQEIPETDAVPRMLWKLTSVILQQIVVNENISLEQEKTIH